MANKVGNILHFVGTRMQITGVGTMLQVLRSIESVRSFEMPDLIMHTSTDIQPFVLANFQQQSAQLEIKTTEFGETFTISKIVFFVKPIAEQYPGQ